MARRGEGIMEGWKLPGEGFAEVSKKVRSVQEAKEGRCEGEGMRRH